ncbi:hypothetical protein E2C01_047740 [Portunus trituberculatus]|uniref:Uncharacterized protein n=1 Tax=Portunus trituberculatus TaxID=210409 RepID=A0A5B7G9N0_PORTR|nr:hypothetical protein [Portunus trituberculatus]
MQRCNEKPQEAKSPRSWWLIVEEFVQRWAAGLPHGTSCAELWNGGAAAAWERRNTTRHSGKCGI